MVDDKGIDVLIIGAGPTGLTLALQLTELGVSVRIVDRSVDRVHESRALAIQPRTLEVLDGLGVGSELVARGNRTVQLRMHVRGRVLTVPMFDLGLEDTAYPYLLFLSQTETERILQERLATLGVAVEREVELKDLVATADTVTAVLRHRGGIEEAVSAAWAVGCDGAHSLVRQLAGIAFKGSSYPQTFLLADAEAVGIEPGSAHAFVSEEGMLFFFPLGAPATWRLLAMRPLTQAASARATVALNDVQALVDSYTEGTVRLHDPAWITDFRIHLRAAARYRSGRILIAGDAAHIHSPAGAQGMNTGIQDAVNLGWKLAQALHGTGDPTVVDTYETERAAVGKAVLRLSNRPFKIATSTNPLIRYGRSRLAPAVLPLVLKATWGRARIFRAVSELGINYRRSPLSQNGPGSHRRGPKAGDRLPDAPVIDNGEPNTLHRALAGAHWHLLLCGPAEDWPDPPGTAFSHFSGRLTCHTLTPHPSAGALHDAQGLAARRLRLAPAGTAQYLIRPDGYIGYRAGGTDLEGLTLYLRRWLG